MRLSKYRTRSDTGRTRGASAVRLDFMAAVAATNRSLVTVIPKYPSLSSSRMMQRYGRSERAVWVRTA